MYPTLFTIGNWSVPTYTVVLDLGLILGLLLTYFEGKRILKDGTLALDLGLWMVIGGIVGGRVAYVLANWQAFSEDWARAVRIWEGGLSFHGAFLAGLLVLFLFSLFRLREQRRVSFWVLGDVITPGLALGITFGWAACALGGCAYGALGEGFGYVLLPDLFGIAASRFATQLTGFAFSLALFVGVWLLRGRWPFSGASFLMYLLLYFSGQFFLEFTRGDEALYWGPWRMAQWLDLVLALAAAVGLMVLWWRASRGGEEEAGEEGAGEQDAGVQEAGEQDAEEQEAGEEGAGVQEAGEQDAGKGEAGGVEEEEGVE
jgi:phosphatidylglycerol---prolipoprotein diacylglyceryl transferase